MAQPAMSVTPAEFPAMWEVISRLRKARGDAAGSLRAKQSAYAMRLGRAVIQADRSKRVAAINRLRDPLGVTRAEGEGQAMAKATTAAQSLTLEFEFERETTNKHRFKETDNGQGTVLESIYVPKYAARLFGLSAMPTGFVITITPKS